jgi:hypothetical protein
VRIPAAELEDLALVVTALGAYAEDLILVGGWAHRLFGLHPWARARDWEPLRTNDVDFAVPLDLKERKTLLSALLEQAGFQVDVKSIHTKPPLTRYRRSNLLVEFVADLKGSATTRKGEAKDVEARAGITAERLRYVYPLQLRPWSPPAGAGPAVLAAVRVANPVTYLFQKILVNSRRSPPKDGGDLVYVADTLDVFGDHLDDLASEWASVLPLLHTKHVQAFREAGAALTKPGDVHRRAERAAAAIGRPRPAADLAALVQFLLARVFP